MTTTAKGVTPEMVEAASALVQKLKLIHADPTFQSVWALSHIRSGPYTGPQYDKELAALEDALSLPAPGEGEAKPVAFRYRGKHKWFYRENYSGAGAADWLPLYEHPAPLSVSSGGLAVKARDLRQIIFDALDLSDDLRNECTEAVVAALSALDRTTLPAAEGLSEWAGWDQARPPWGATKHKDAVLEALFRGPWSVEDAAALLGFIDRTWTRRPNKGTL